MEGIDLIQDFMILLLAAGVAGSLCRRLGLSAIVGYLIAGIVIGPYTPPFSMIVDEHRIMALSQVGLAFVMFSIGLDLSLTKLGRLGVPTIVATGIGAFFMFNFTLLLGSVLGWTPLHSFFVGAMLMVSSSAVIAKIMQEQHLGHERAAQIALGITIVEDVLAVIMLTVLGSQGGSGGEEESVGGVLAVMSAFVVLLLAAGLLLLPRLLRRLDSKADPDLQTVMVAGLLFLLAFATVKAGYSLALGAFLFGAVMAELPQRHGIEKSFEGIRSLFSSIFFVSIGMMIDPRLLSDVWVSVLALGLFSLIVRPIACGFALMLVGIPPREARRGGLLLTPLGEFTFIIAQAGVTAAILPPSFYPVAVGLSIMTVLATPILNRYADPILDLIERLEPAWLQRLLAAYHDWLRQLQQRPAPPMAWKLIRSRLLQIAVEMLLISGLLIFSRQILQAVEASVVANWLEETMLNIAFWTGLSLLVLVPLVAIWRNVCVASLIAAETFGGHFLPPPVINFGLRAVAALGLGYWLHVLLPIHAFTLWGWILIGLATLVVVIIFSNRLVYWHSIWHNSVSEVLAEPGSPEDARAQSRAAMGQNLESWSIRLEDCVIPDASSHAGHTLASLAIPSRFGCSVIEVERNGYILAPPSPDFALYSGDKLLLLGKSQEIKQARTFLQGARAPAGNADEFAGSVLETCPVSSSERTGRSLAELKITQQTGVRVVGIQRGQQQIINPTGQERLWENDHLLVLGTLDQIRRFRRWLKPAEPASPSPAAGEQTPAG